MNFIENNQSPDLEELPELKRKVEEQKNDAKKMFSELNEDSNVDNLLSDLFYKSIKLFFDTGFDLAKKLNLELFESFKFEDDKNKK